VDEDSRSLAEGSRNLFESRWLLGLQTVQELVHLIEDESQRLRNSGFGTGHVSMVRPVSSSRIDPTGWLAYSFG